ncbi:hypothetical protein INT45_003861 [Circinella minor]|uniref:Uncharacterized protein n=1 Tax=Circinella minor TaxID=1195481 RepID=A0A8H7SF67_9FUNG|nr:hypothetical protein INT45_003861 [Circinella minor]
MYKFSKTKIRRPYISKHLSEEEKDKLTERLLVDPTVTPKAAVQGSNRRTGQTVDSVIEINPILGSFLVMYRSPAIKTYCRFYDLPAVTDVTYKAIEKGYYLCTTGFLQAYQQYTGKNDGVRFLKGCYMHPMQSVQRISSNHNIISYEEADKFRELVYTIRTTKDAEKFCRSCNEVVTRYKNSYKWLQ